MQKAVILDADNTLWQLQVLYDEARERFLDLLQSRGIDRNEARTRSKEFSAAYINKINPATGQKYLYTAARLPASFEATLRFFLPEVAQADVEQATALANGVFERKAALMPGVGDVLKALKDAGYKLIILTKGEEWVQEKRLQEFDYIGLIDVTHIVSEKTWGVFDDLIIDHDIDPAASFSLGDSVSSDIIPAREAGLHTILLQSHTWELEKKGDIPADTITVPDLMSALNTIQDKEKKMNVTPEQTAQLKEKIRRHWSIATTGDPDGWTERNPAWGQCAVTACAVQDELGGEVVWAEAALPDGRKISHYFNKLDNGEELDFTREQFPAGTVIAPGQPKKKEFPTTRDYVLSFTKTAVRYELLKSRLCP